MSVNRNKVLALTGVNTQRKTQDELVSFFNKTLKRPIHGLCFSPYQDGQQPGSQLTEAQIRRRIEIIKPHTNWIRSFSCTDGNEMIPRIAKEYGLKTLVGAWLGKSDDTNEKEIANLIQLVKEGYVDVAAIGNEVMYRGDLTEEELLDYIHRVKTEIPGTPVGYVDAYYEFENRPQIVEACDVILANCYPFWEGCSIEYSLLYMKDQYARAKKVANGKKVIISETGWPDTGEQFHGAKPSVKNALIYFLNAQQWSEEDDIEIFYFSSFDESWKIEDEGVVGAFWGLWDKNEELKY